jgi:RHH-type transcriptional regulator, proline utilization regulon repressor / proline dehydrogenase / delta 1-pyrroline-5-carboxylate dehydrogenase
MGKELYGEGADNDPTMAPAGSMRRSATTRTAALPGSALLENGANTSFVNRIVDEKLPPEEVSDPIAQIEALETIPIRGFPQPLDDLWSQSAQLGRASISPSSRR